jgi:hypothetical protein
MTVQRTRELLGNKVSHLNDKEILTFNNTTDLLLEVLIKQSLIKIPSSKKRKVRLQCRK